MKKAFLTLLLVGLGFMLAAQETDKTELTLTVGDTLVWKPFEDCNTIGYNISGPRVVTFSYLGFGEKIQIIAKQEGRSSITATCSDSDPAKSIVAHITVEKPYVAPIVEKLEKPQTQPFTATYAFNPPANNFFITVTDPGNHCKETFVKVGDNEAYNDGHGTDRFWNITTGKNWYYRPDAQGWTDDVDWEFEPFGESFFPINAFANEVDKSDLSQYYIGMDKVLDIDCWVFFVDSDNGVVRYWVDPANGCTLQRQVNTDEPRVVTVYDLKYNRLYFGPSFKKGLHDTTR